MLHCNLQSQDKTFDDFIDVVCGENWIVFQGGKMIYRSDLSDRMDVAHVGSSLSIKSAMAGSQAIGCEPADVAAEFFKAGTQGD